MKLIDLKVREWLSNVDDSISFFPTPSDVVSGSELPGVFVAPAVGLAAEERYQSYFDEYDASRGRRGNIVFHPAGAFDSKTPRVGVACHIFVQNPSSAENAQNEGRVEEFNDKYTRELLSALKSDSVEPGMVGAADMLVAKCLAQNALATSAWLGHLFLENFNAPSLAADLLLLIGRLPHKLSVPHGPMMALAGFSSASPAVQEAAIRAFENWGGAESLRLLKAARVGCPWLQEYQDSVIQDLKLAHEENS